MANFLPVASGVTATIQTHPEVFIEAIGGVSVLKNGYIRNINKVINSANLRKLFSTSASGDGFVQTDGRDCAWNPLKSGEFDLKKVDLTYSKINGEECIPALQQILAEQEFPSVANNECAPDIEAAILKYVTKKMALAVENQIFSDIVTEAAADTDVVDVVGTTLDVTNITDEIAKVYIAIPDAVIQEQAYDPVQGAIRCYINPSDFKKLRIALNAEATATNVTLPSWTINKEDRKVYFLDMEVVAAQGIPANKMIAGAYNNLVAVSNFATDEISVKVKQGTDLDNEDKLFIKANWGAKGSYIFGNEVVGYGL